MSAAQLGAAVDEPATPPPQPRPKPYADATGVFAKLIKLLPLATDEEAATFERRARRFTRRLGPLSLGRLVDDRRRPILWYACDTVWKSNFYGAFVAIPVPRRSTEPGRPRHRRAPDTLVDFHTGATATITPRWTYCSTRAARYRRSCPSTTACRRTSTRIGWATPESRKRSSPGHIAN